MNGLRHELKFTLHKDAATILKQRLSLLLPFDNNANHNGEYYVRSLYFDTIDADAYFEKMDGVQTRRKYRIRFYNQNLDFIRLECKEKFDSMTLKRQARISLPYAQKIIANQIEALDVEGARAAGRAMLTSAPTLAALGPVSKAPDPARIAERMKG